MSKKNYIAIGDALKAAFAIAKNEGKPFSVRQEELVIMEIARVLRNGNVNFDWNRFETYVLGEEQ